MQTSSEIVNDGNTGIKKVWSKPVFEIISHDIIKGGPHHLPHAESTTYTS